MELKWIGNINSGYSFKPEKASYRLIPNGHGWRICIVKQSSSGNYLYKITNAKTGAVVKEATVTGSWSYFSILPEDAVNGLIFESKSTTATLVVIADHDAFTPKKL